MVPLKQLIGLFIVWVFCISFAYASNETQLETYYKLDAGDKIQIVVFGEDDLTLSTTLAQGGVINYPYLGMIKSAGLTIAELETKITHGLKGDYLVNPSVHVSVLQYRPFYIHGEVKSPGSYPYQPNLTLEKAVVLAGGMTERASSDNVSILRVIDGQEKRIKSTMQSLVKPGDAIFIKDTFF